MSDTSQNLRAIVNADGAVILDISRGKISTLNPIGAYIWEALQRGDAINVIISKLSRDTGESPETIELDVCEFLDSLKEKQLFNR